jgi:hypothetical protein
MTHMQQCHNVWTATYAPIGFDSATSRRPMLIRRVSKIPGLE